jgi:predicted nucleotidyltransferase
MSENIASTLFSKTQRAVLELLFSSTDSQYHLREILRKSEVGQGTVQRELARMVKAGILSKRRQGHQVYYQANPECPIYSELRGLVLKTMGVSEQIRSALASIKSRIRLAAIYGSFARGQENAKSDVDLLIIGDVSLREIVKTLQKSQDSLGREINATVYPPAEFTKKLKEGNHFITSLEKEPIVYLIGDAHVLERLGE